MASVQSKNTNFVAISCLLLVLLFLGFQPLQAALTGCPGYQPMQACKATLPGCPEHKSWPELVGIPGCEASALIKKENSAYDPIVVPHNTVVPLNWVCSRVFIPIEGHMGLVSDTPRTG